MTNIRKFLNPLQLNIQAKCFTEEIPEKIYLLTMPFLHRTFLVLAEMESDKYFRLPEKHWNSTITQKLKYLRNTIQFPAFDIFIEFSCRCNTTSSYKFIFPELTSLRLISYTAYHFARYFTNTGHSKYYSIPVKGYSSKM